MSTTRVARLIFEYDGDEIRLVRQQVVDMVADAVDLALPLRAGLYVDVRDVAGKTLGRVSARGAMKASAEVFPQRAGDPIYRVDVPRPKGAFTVVIAAPPEAAEVSVVRGPPQPSPHILGEVRATTLATFPLDLR